MTDRQEQVQQVAEEFCRLLNNYDPRRGAFERYAYLSLRNALHRQARAAARESRRQACTVSLDEMLEMREEVRNA